MKAILLVRVSTTVQELKEQEKEVYDLAVKDGYSDADIIPICEKESAIKLKEEERLGLNRLKEVVDTEDVKDVYIWEVSRLARTKKVLFSMEEYFVTRKIQVTFKAPNFFRLLKDDGTLDEGADMIFTIYAQLAESEMRTKKERFKRSKDARRKQGYFTGGTILYGYKTDESKKLVVDEETSEVVRMLFAMYLTGKYSYRSLAKEVQSMGIFTDKSFITCQTAIKKILTNVAYAGLPSAEGSYTKLKTQGNIYPALVTVEMVEKCKELAQNNIIQPKKKYSTLYFAKGILRCPECGKVMMAVKARNFYHCTKCESNLGININMVDSALWLCASPVYKAKMDKKDESQKEYYEVQITLLSQKIEVAQKDIEGMRNRAEKIEYKAYVDGTMDATKADKYIADLNQKIEAQNKEIVSYQSQIQSFQNLLLEHSGEYEGEYIDDISGITDDKVRYDIIHQVIKWATISRMENNKMLTVITICDYLDNEHKYLLDSRNHKIYIEFTPDGKGIVEAEGAFIQRFVSTYQAQDRREDYLAYQKAYREKMKNNKDAKKANAERQRKYRMKKALEAQNND